MRQHKFNAVATINDGIRFDSKKEASFYNDLKLREKSGEIIFFLRQVPLHLPGKTKMVVDFQVFNANGSVEFIDVKGMKTDIYKLKKRQVENIYPIKIKEV